MAFMSLYRTYALRRVEAAAQAQNPSPSLMERAGLATAGHARRVMGERGRSVLVIAGPGNNGGDAFEAAVHLKEWFYKVDVLFLGDAARLPADAARAFGKW